jgi:hypothetical protein
MFLLKNCNGRRLDGGKKIGTFCGKKAQNTICSIRDNNGEKHTK